MNTSSGTHLPKAQISLEDCRDIEQILFDGVAKAIPEDKRFWDGYAMCLYNFSIALVTNVEIKS